MSQISTSQSEVSVCFSTGALTLLNDCYAFILAKSCFFGDHQGFNFSPCWSDVMVYLYSLLWHHG